MNGLSSQTCEACKPGTPALNEAEVKELLQQLDPAWSVDAHVLRRTWKTADFTSAFSQATAIALIAEAQAHHPDLQVGWGKLVCELTTHSIGGLLRNDFIVAAKIDAALAG